MSNKTDSHANPISLPQQTQEACPLEIDMRLRLPLNGDSVGTYIYDADATMVAQIRGWGHLTGQSGLRLNGDVAVKVQEARQRYIVEACNAYPELKAENEKLRGARRIHELDNHHNAAWCHYCQPTLEEDANRMRELRERAASAEAARDQLQRERDTAREQVETTHEALRALDDIQAEQATRLESAESSLSQIRQALQNLVDAARPSFPKTPFREALDAAKALLHASEGRQDLQQDERP